MVQFKNKLDEMLAEGVLASGIQKNAIIAKIRDYIKTISVDDLKKQISVIDSKVELSLLQAVGVPGGAQSTFFYVVQNL